MLQEALKIISLPDLRKSLDSGEIGEEIYKLITDLYPICRSITGDGVRETFKIIKKLRTN